MFTHILIASDGSEVSRRAVTQGLTLAKALGARVTAVSVLDTRVLVGMPYISTEPRAFDVFPLLDALRKETRACVDDAAAEGTRLGVRVTPEVLEGTPAEAILERARKLGAELVVMGTQGRTGLKLMVMGSTAQAVVHGAPCPVLLVR